MCEGRLESSRPVRRWPAQLDLVFRRGQTRTVLERCRHEGPLRVQRLFYPDSSGTAHCYLLHPPGGVVLGDLLSVAVEHRSGRALLTTPSAGRFYSGGGFAEPQRQHIELNVLSGILEWLPQETILFSGAQAQLDTRIELAKGAKLAYWDVLVLGRPACSDRFIEGFCRQRLRIRREGRMLLHDQLRLEAGDRVCFSRQGLFGASTVGLAVFTDTASEELIKAWLASENTAQKSGTFSLSQRGELLLARYLGDDAQYCRAAFSRLWQALNTECHGHFPAEPRIWHT